MVFWTYVLLLPALPFLSPLSLSFSPPSLSFLSPFSPPCLSFLSALFLLLSLSLPRYTAQGSITCLGSDTWDINTAVCTPEDGCGGTANNLGVAGLSPGIGAGTASQKTAAAACDKGHSAGGEVKCVDGVWAAHTASCAEVECVATESNLGVFGLRLGLGAGAKSQGLVAVGSASCEDGYAGAGALKCVKGAWSKHTARYAHGGAS